MMRLRRARLAVALLAAQLLIACSSGPAATPVPTGLVTPAGMSVQPSATVLAVAPTETAAPPTGTLPPSTEGALATETIFVPPPTASPAPTSGVTPALYSYTVLKRYPHDRTAFTQGLDFDEGILYEGTGLNGQSSLRKVNLETGGVEQSIPLDAQYFGEGITILDDRVYQLTWQNQLGFVYDDQSFALIRDFIYPTEGWGITHDGERLIMSDGTATIYFLDPESLQETGRIAVRDQNGPVAMLNELEYVDGEIYANVWQTDRIARISPATGEVLGWIDMAGLLSEEDRAQPVDVLNGIAYLPDERRLFVTGKLWPWIFEIELVPSN
jgi:glutaminyl-peptide cyclotransferase